MQRVVIEKVIGGESGSLTRRSRARIFGEKIRIPG